MKTELMKELFEAWFKNQPLPTNGTVTPQGEVGYAQEALEWAFQAACNMFLPFVEVIADDAEGEAGDICAFYDDDGHIWWGCWGDRNNSTGYTILERNGKYAIRESELKQGEK
jgi:hypothetical protein